MFQEFINNDKILDTIYIANKDKTQQDNKRIELYNLLKDTFERMKEKYDLKQFHFHLPDNTSFLRFHKPSRYGDNLTQIRPTVKIANKKLIPVSAFEEGKVFNGFRYVKPLIYKSMHIGSVEISVGFKAINSWMEKTYKGHNYLILKKSIIEKKVFLEEQKQYEESFISDNYLHEISTIIEIDEEEHHEYLSSQIFNMINSQLKIKVKKELESSKEFIVWSKTPDNNFIGSVFKPIFNIEKKQIAYLINYTANKEYQKYKKLFYVVFSGGTILNIIIFLFIGYILFKRDQEHLKNEELKKLIKELQLAKTKISAKQLELESINSSLEHKIDQSIKEARKKDKVLMQQSKLASMGEMIGNISHQWRQPLNAFALQIQDIEEAYEFDELDEKYIKQLIERSMKQINFMSRTIEDFRNFFEPNKTKVNFDLVKSINEALEIVQLSLKDNVITIDLQQEKTKHNTIGFPNEFKQVILNIINNTKDAFNEQIDQGVKINTPKIFICIKEKDNEQIITIEDTAGGIPNNVLDKIFEPYFTTKDEGKGTGIGLYMSKMIIEQSMEGSLNVENSKVGAKFTIKLLSDKEEGN